MESLSTYIPMDRRQALAQQKTVPTRARGAVLFADISGFTRLTTEFAQQLGVQRGAEEMTHHLNRVFGALIDEVHRYHGSVIGFSGDAITCWFEDKAYNDKKALGQSGRYATACALAMQEAITQFASVTTPMNIAISFNIKVVVVAGPARRFLVGDPQIQLIEILAGSLLDRITLAEKLLEPGQVLVGAEVLGLFGEDAIIESWQQSASGERFAIIQGLKTAVPPHPWPEIATLDNSTARAWLLPPVYNRLIRGEGTFLSELRPAVALFLAFNNLDYDDDEEAGSKLDSYIRWVQGIITHYDGTFLQLTIGDKGSYFYAAFGAPIAHEDDPARAIAAAIELRRPPTGLNYFRSTGIGISQGSMYAGAYGSSTRSIYGVLGNEVNIAARLMSHAQATQILITQRIAEATETDFRFESLDPVSLKGLAQPLPLWSVIGRHTGPLREQSPEQKSIPMMGREDQLAILVEQLQALLDGRHAPCIIIEGEAGIGKSRLVTELVSETGTFMIQPLIGSGEAIEKSTPYHAWRPIFQQLFDLQTTADGDLRSQWQQQVLNQLEAINPDLLQLAPLLNMILPLDLPESELTRQISGQVRSDNAHELYISIIKAKVHEQPLLLVLEDAHWVDSASWLLARRVSQEVANTLLVIVTRPSVDLTLTTYTELSNNPKTIHMRLGRLTIADIESLICQRLGITRLPKAVASLINEKAEGHPFFSEELAYALRDAGLIQIIDGQCHVTLTVEELRQMDFPNTIQGIINSRIDRLDPAQQLMLKVASVIGRLFAYRTLYDIHPLESDKPGLLNYLSNLEEFEITLLDRPEPDLAYIFKHMITQEVTYTLLLYTQRQELHQAVASWYEKSYADDLSPYYPLLAYHWQRAKVTHKAIDYLEKAGEQALKAYANREAVGFFSEALTLDTQFEINNTPRRRARWERQLGTAYLNLGQLKEGQEHLELALSLLGNAPPTTQAGWATGVLSQTLKQSWHRLRSVPQNNLSPETKENMLETARSYALLSPMYYVNGRMVPLLYSQLRSLNLGERLEPTPELAQGYASMSVVAGTIPQHKWANSYSQMALATAEAINDPATLAFVLSRISIYHSGVGQLTRVRELCEQSGEIAERLGDRRLWGENMSFLAQAAIYSGNFNSGSQLSSDLYAAAYRHQNVLHQVWALIGQAQCAVRLDQLDNAVAFAKEALKLLKEAEIKETVSEIIIQGVLAMAYLRQGELVQAQNAADMVQELLAPSSRTGYAVLDGHTGSTEVYLALWKASQNGNGAAASNWTKLAQKSCKVFHQQAKVYPLAEPRAWLYQGNYHQLDGYLNKAQEAWAKSLAAATQLGMRYDEGRVHYEIGRHLPTTDPGRQSHLNQAQVIFSEAGAPYDLNRVQVALNQSNGLSA